MGGFLCRPWMFPNGLSLIADIQPRPVFFVFVMLAVSAADHSGF